VEEVVHDEISRLPEPFRAPVILCCVEGLSYDLAANRLGVTEPTLRGRLHRARKRLASRLRGRGIRAGMFTSAVEPVRLTIPPLPPMLVESTVQFSVQWSSVTSLLSGAAIIPDSIAGLAQGVIKVMLLQSLKLAGIGVLLAAGVLGSVVVAQQRENGGFDGRIQTAENSAVKAEQKPNARIDEERAQSQLAEIRRAEKEKRLHELSLKERTKQVEKQLDLLIDAEFPKGITLVELLKYIKQETTKTQPPGIPIYVSPTGLEEAKQAMEFIVTVNVKQESVRRILEQALRETGLNFAATDGFLKIDSRTGILELRVQEIDRKLDHVLEALARLEKAR
jgi:Sigma-70, region 4